MKASQNKYLTQNQDKGYLAWMGTKLQLTYCITKFTSSNGSDASYIIFFCFTKCFNKSRKCLMLVNVHGKYLMDWIHSPLCVLTSYSLCREILQMYRNAAQDGMFLYGISVCLKSLQISVCVFYIESLSTKTNLFTNQPWSRFPVIYLCCL